MDPAVSRQQGPSRPAVFVAQGAITLVVVLFVSFALDDITTDNAAGFLPEYRMLAAAGVWGLFVAYSLLRRGHHVVGTTSLILVGATAWIALDGIGHKRDGGWGTFWPEYSVVLVTSVWFVGLSVILVAVGRRALKNAATNSTSCAITRDFCG